MGLILDTSILIASERKGESVDQLLSRVEEAHGGNDVAISAVTVVELTHGLYRAKTDQMRNLRRAFAEEVFRGMVIHPLTTEIARLAGQMDAEQAAGGNRLAFEDIVIGATALYLGYDVLTLNLRHFERVPNLRVLTL